MEILSFDNTANNRIKRDPNQDNLFNLFQKNIVNNSKNMTLEIYIVPREFEMRLDRVSDYIYGSSSYMEELMVLNDIISPYSVKEGQYIYFCQVDNLQKLYTIDDLQNLKSVARQNLIKSNQNNLNLYGTSDQNLPHTVKPSNLQQVKVTKDNKIQIINSFQ
jgi:hypothetical protein